MEDYRFRDLERRADKLEARVDGMDRENNILRKEFELESANTENFRKEVVKIWNEQDVRHRENRRLLRTIIGTIIAGFFLTRAGEILNLLGKFFSGR